MDLILRFLLLGAFSVFPLSLLALEKSIESRRVWVSARLLLTLQGLLILILSNC